ncbi:hypothetical protein BDW02DRAFT_500944 [Decorospora gaudefroyi]|uniref:F-box domain-containing protein n=1 Tax=Decorospora gaudefroyi TaxID=184978 RepID=A0A6A5KD78_9PLEO|nr:hypothetical protein BDW02DRAFT_500944 [Decorospora gaudefroyi]
MDVPTPPQKRKASISSPSRLTKRTRSISTSFRVNHKTARLEVIRDTEIPVVSKIPQASLSGLPEELLMSIVQHLERNRNALAKLCRTNRRFKRLSETVLYKEISPGCCVGHKGQTERVMRDATLAENVHVAHFVFAFMTTTSAALLAREERLQVMKNICNVRKMHIYEGPRSAAKSARLAEELGWLALLNKAVSGHVSTPSNKFAHLKELEISMNTVSLADISSVFHLPSLHTLCLHQVHQTTNIEGWSIPEGTCNIQTLEIEASFIDIAAVTQIISSMKALKSFTYSPMTYDWEPFGSEDNPMSSWVAHSWKELGDALRKHSQSLEVMNVSEHTDPEILNLVYPNGRAVGTLGSFKDFPKLRNVTAPIEAFLNVELGQNDLSVYLPFQLVNFSTALTTENKAAVACYPSALESLATVMRPGPEACIFLTIEEELPAVQELWLPEKIRTLVNAGIRIHIMNQNGVSEITLDDLTMPASEASEDEEPEEPEESPNDEQTGYVAAGNDSAA